MESKKLSDNVSVGHQPTAEDLTNLRALGYTTIVNLRTEGEKNQPLDPAAEGSEAQTAGLAYHHIPVSMANPSTEQVEALRAAIRNSDGPVYVHCGAGQRACAMSLLATDENTPPDELIAKADSLGFPVVDDQLRSFIEQQAGKKG